MLPLAYASPSAPAPSNPMEKDVAIDASARSNGRPRSEKSSQAILDTTNAMLLHTSVRDISIESVAKKAGVGKTTIYRWWPNKVSLVLDAMAGPMSALPAPVTGGKPKELLERQLERFARLCRGRSGKIIAEIYAEAQISQDTQALFVEKFLNHHEDVLMNILEQGKANGDFRRDLDVRLTTEMVYGSFFYHLMRHPMPLDQNNANSIIVESLRMCQ